MTRRAITAADFSQFAIMGEAQIAPDGQRIAFTVQTVDREENSYRTAIWMAPVAGAIGAARLFVAEGSGPRWSPDGRTLAFVTKREGPLPAPREGEDAGARDKRCGKGKPQIWLIPVDGGEAQQLTSARNGASGPVWSPDSTRLLFSAKTGEIPEMPKHDGQPEPRARRITRALYRFNGAGYIYEQRTHLFVIPAAGGAATQLTDGDWDDDSPAWSPDGQQIAFGTDRHDDRWRFPHGEIWLMQADGLEQRPLLAEEGHDYSSPAWSPDGQQIACLGGPTWNSGGHTDVYVFRPGEAPRCLTTDHFQSFSDAIGSDMRNNHPDPTPRWSSDGQTIFIVGNARGAGNIYALHAATGGLHQVTQGQHHVVGWSMDAAANAIALTLATPHQPSDLFAHWRDSGHTHRLTDINADLLGQLTLATPETFTFRGAQDWECEGWILKPPHFDPDERYPMLLEVHGGPNTCYGYSFYQEFQLLAAQGYVVVFTNPRGSTSYGRVFGQAVRGIWGQEDYEDVMAAVHTVVARGYIDRDRLGVLGGSYGGFMTSWIIGHNHEFRAAISDRAFNDARSFYGTSDVGPLLSRENWEVPWWEDPQRYAQHSPLSFVQQITTPLLIIHSEEDYRCPIEQAEQLFVALLHLGREVEMLRFEGQSHDLSRNGHPRLRVERLEAIVEWFTRHIPTNTLAHANGHAAEHAMEWEGAPSPV